MKASSSGSISGSCRLWECCGKADQMSTGGRCCRGEGGWGKRSGKCGAYFNQCARGNKNGTRANRQTQGGECQRLTQDSGRRKVGDSWDGGGGFLGVGWNMICFRLSDLLILCTNFGATCLLIGFSLPDDTLERRAEGWLRCVCLCDWLLNAHITTQLGNFELI